MAPKNAANKPKRCLNCRSNKHENNDCYADCFRCRQKKLTGNQARKAREEGKDDGHNCELYRMKLPVPTYDKNYVRRLYENDFDTVSNIRGLARALEKKFDIQEVTSTLFTNDTTLICMPERNPKHSALTFNGDVGFFSFKSLYEIVNEIYWFKNWLAGRIRHHSENMMTAMQIQHQEEPLNKGEQPATVLRTRLNIGLDNEVLNGLIMKLSQGSKLRIWTKVWITNKYGKKEHKEFEQSVEFIWLEKTNDRFIIETSHCDILTYSHRTGLTEQNFVVGFEFNEQYLRTCLDITAFLVDYSPKMPTNWFGRYLRNFNVEVKAEDSQVKFYEHWFKDLVRACIEDELDESQLEACKEMVTSMTHCVIGPPGTGKSLVLALTTIYLAIRHGLYILITTTRNHSGWSLTTEIDKLARKAYDRGFLKKEDIEALVIHHYPEIRSSASVPLPARLKTKGGLSLVKKAKRGQPQPDPIKYKIVVSTVGHAFAAVFDDHYVDALFCEEAGLMHMTETLAVLSRLTLGKYTHLLNNKQAKIAAWADLMNERPKMVHFIGDPYQLEPVYGADVRVCETKAAFDIGETLSPMAQLYRSSERELFSILKVCRRGTETVFQPIFDRFYTDLGIEVRYKGPLVHFESYAPDDNEHEYPYVYKSPLSQLAGRKNVKSIYVHGPPHTERSQGSSYYNQTFLEIILSMLKDLLNYATIDGEQIKLTDIMLIVAYKADQYFARSIFKLAGMYDANDEANSIKILTVDQAQGLQAPIVILSLARTEQEGFMAGYNVANYGFRQNGRFVVATTRSQCLRIIVANPEKTKATVGNKPESESDLHFISQIHSRKANETPVEYEKRGVAYIVVNTVVAGDEQNQ